ncbi:MAG: S9 family peptidase, partial [bacterium]|nr:S9 family peptidase [bacterium]
MIRRPQLFFVLTAVFLAACAGPGGEHVTGPSQTYTMEQFVKTLSIGGASFNPDETKLLVSSNETGVFNVYELDLASKERSPVTQGENTTFAETYMPNDERILFSRDQEGNEIDHLYLRDLDGTVRDLTDVEEAKEHFAGFSNDLESFYTISNGRDARFFDLFEWNVASLEKEMVYENTQGLDPEELSPDRRWLVLSKSNTTNDSDLLVADLANGGDPVLISEHEGEAAFAAEAISVDSSYLYYTSNEIGEFSVLSRYEFATGNHEDVYSADWDVVFTYFSRLGAFRVIGTNEDGYTKVKITRTATGEALDIPGLPAGTVSGIAFSNSENLMKLTVSSDTLPGSIF